MGRRPSLKTVQERANKEYKLNDCPRCKSEGSMEFMPAEFQDSEVIKNAKCVDCGLEVTHYYQWIETEVREGQGSPGTRTIREENKQ